MARISKRISNKINKAKQEQQPKETKKKYGRDIWLIVLIVVNFLLLITSWQNLLSSPTNFAAYFLLEIVLIVMYINRHANMSEKVAKWMYRTQIGLMAVILALFIITAIGYFVN